MRALVRLFIGRTGAGIPACRFLTYKGLYMYAIIYNRDGVELWRLELNDDATLDPNTYARIFAGLYGMEIMNGEEPGATIPDGGEDFSVVIQEEPGAVRRWASANYMLRGEA